MNRPVKMKDIELRIKSFPIKKFLGTAGSTGEVQTFKEEIIKIVAKIFQKIEERIT